MSIFYRDIAQECASFYTTGTANAGQLCQMSKNDTVTACTDGSPIHGQIQTVRTGVASVVVRGFIYTKYSGTAPTVGFNPLVAFNGLYVKVSAGAKEYLVVSVNESTKEICIML